MLFSRCTREGPISIAGRKTGFLEFRVHARSHLKQFYNQSASSKIPQNYQVLRILFQGRFFGALPMSPALHWALCDGPAFLGLLPVLDEPGSSNQSIIRRLDLSRGTSEQLACFVSAKQHATPNKPNKPRVSTTKKVTRQ